MDIIRSAKSTSFSLLQPEKARFPILVNIFGKTTFSSSIKFFEFCEKSSLICFTPSGIVKVPFTKSLLSTFNKMPSFISITTLFFSIYFIIKQFKNQYHV